MEYPLIIFILFTIVVIAIIIIWTNLQARKKQGNLLISSFGEPPADTEYELDSIKTYFSYKSKKAAGNMTVDDITWNDLDMDKVYKRINVCLSSVGEEYLYNCLHELQSKPDLLLAREKAVEFFTEHPKERLAAQKILARLGKRNYNGIATLIFNTDINMFKHPFVFKALSLLPLLCALTLIFGVSIGIGCIVASFIINTIVYVWTKLKIDSEIPTVDYFASMLYCCKKLCGLEYLNSLPVMTDIKKYYSVFKPLQGAFPAASISRYELADVLIEYFNILFMINIRKYNRVMKMIIRHKEDFHALYRAFGEIDLALCTASFRKSLPAYSTPEFQEENVIEFEKLFHPLIESPFTNDGLIKNNSLITGSNASGKSTFIKALAVNGILAQTIYTCAAEKFKARYSLIVTSMALRDDITGGDSYFIVEVKSLKRILVYMKTYTCTCYIDEILRGTNTIERIAASASVLEYLHTRDCLCVAASHDIELTNILADKFDNYHFCEQVTDEGITFDYKIKPGASTTRNAIKLLKFMNFDKEIIDKAEALTQNCALNNFNTTNGSLVQIQNGGSS